MAHDEGPSDLPATWPFRAAGTLLVIALAWFCLGFAIKDQGEELGHHMQVFWLLLLARIVAEMVRSFARQWVPVGPSAVALEVIFTVTDPPVKLLRRVIPVVRIGGVGLDLSIMVLLLVVFILMSVAQP
jgi:YggT family protein